VKQRIGVVRADQEAPAVGRERHRVAHQAPEDLLGANELEHSVPRRDRSRSSRFRLPLTTARLPRGQNEQVKKERPKQSAALGTCCHSHGAEVRFGPAVPLQRFADEVSDARRPLPATRRRRARALSPPRRTGLMDLAAVLAWAAARARLTCASFSVDRVPLRRLDRASVQRRRPRSSACASAHRPTTACILFGESEAGAGTAGRAGSAGPVGCASPSSTRLASEAAKWRDDQPDASLEVLVPCSARLPRRVLCTGRRHLSGHPASTVGPRRPSSFARVIAFARGDAPFDASLACLAHHRAPTHRFDAGCPCGFFAWRRWPGRLCADRRRAFWLGRSAVLVYAPLHRTHTEPAAGHAPALS
jgi:hypothetical protein